MPATAPIKIALIGFANDLEKRQISNLFSRAGHWQQPWEIVHTAEDADFLLATSEAENGNLPGLGFPPEYLIAYAEKPVNTAQWHLHRSPSKKPPSALEFTLLMKEIALRFNASAAGAAKTGSKAMAPAVGRQFNWRERLKILIVGSVNSGKTTAIMTLTNGNAVSTETQPSDHTQLSKKTTTVAMDFGHIPMNTDTQLHIYGAPGQRRFDFMNDILVRNALGIIILINNEISNPLSDLDYYLNIHSNFLRNGKAVIGVTHNDVSPTPSLNEYASYIRSKNQNWPVMKVDARKHSDMMKLVDTLLAVTIKS